MRKRSASESGRGNPSPGKEDQGQIHAKLRKIRHTSGKGEDVGISKRKASYIIETPNNANKRKTQSVDEPPANNRYPNNNENAGIIGNLRRTTSVPASSVDENLSTRRRTVPGSTENDPTKQKQEPLPDIMHDWEIIVKSLRETPAEENSASKLPKSINSKPNLTRSIKQDLTDSDKENSSLKKKSVDELLGRPNEFSTPSTSSNGTKLKSNKEREETPTKIHSTEASPTEEGESTWRRPTRSTYKAFENVFESPELVELPLAETEVVGELKKEVQVFKTLLTPKKLILPETTSTPISEAKQNTPVRSSLKNKERKMDHLTITNTDEKKKRGRPKRTPLKDGKNIKGRRITRGMEKEGITVISEESNESDEDQEDLRILTKVKSTPETNTEEYKNTSGDSEMDFIGFGSPLSTKKHKFKTPPKSVIETPKSNREISKSNKEIPKYNRESAKSNRESPKSNKETPKSNRETPKSNRETPKSNRETPKSNRETPKSNKEAPKFNREGPKSNRQTPISNRESPISNRETPKSNREILKSNRETPKSNREASKSNRETPKSNKETPKSNNNAPKYNKELPKYNKELPKYNKELHNFIEEPPKLNSKEPPFKFNYKELTNSYYKEPSKSSSYKEVIVEETLREDTTFSPVENNESTDFNDIKDYILNSPSESCLADNNEHTLKVEQIDEVEDDDDDYNSAVDDDDDSCDRGNIDIIDSNNLPQTTKSSISLSEFECLFGSDDDSMLDFEGFPVAVEEQEKSCRRCSLVLGNLDALRQHVKVGHRRVYACPFDLGQCGQWRGAIDLQNHLRRDHSSLLTFLQLNISSDILSGKIANWADGEEGCGVCLMPLEQPHRCIHEMLVHCIWPPSLLSLSSVLVDQHVSLWWTGRTLAFACHLCHTPQTSLSRNCTIPIVTSSPHCFPTLFSNHLRNVHLLNLPLIQGWWLMIRLLLSLPASPRRTLSSIVSLGVDSKVSYSSCLICSAPLSFYCNINLKISYGLCSKCEYICRSEMQCWFNCKAAVPARYNFILNHLLTDHKSQIHGAWCVVCGAWAPNILIHLAKCGDNKSALSCKFCTFKLEGLSILRKAWHSLNHHTYPCPIPNCVMPLYSHGQQGSHHRLPTARTLLNHLLGQHLPEWVGFTLDQVSTLIYNSKKTHGVVLTAFSAQHLNGIWRSLSGHKYCLNKGVISPIDTVKLSMMCLLCMHSWEEDLAWPSKEESALCSECTLMLSQCGGGDLTPQCPVFKCLENISSFTDLYQHLTLVHKLSPLSNRTNCSYCGSVSLGSPLSTITHNLLQHNIACLLCPFTAPTASQIHAHRATMHGLPSWNAVFQHLKLEDLAQKKTKEKPKLIGGVVRVWNGETGTHAQWDPPVNISKFLSNDLEEPEVGVISQSSIQEPYFITTESPIGDLNEVDPWCSSLCAVSMSPSKNFVDTLINDRDVKPEISPLVTKLKGSTVNGTSGLEENCVVEAMSPEMLIPSVTVAEDSDENSTDSEGLSNNDHSRTEDVKIMPDPREENISDSSDEVDSGSEPALEIDSSAPSPEPSLSNAKFATTSKFSKSNELKLKNCLTVTIPVSIPSTHEIKTLINHKSGSDIETEMSINSKQPPTILQSVKEPVQRAITPPVVKAEDKIPTLGQVESLNSVMAESLQSMSKALSCTRSQDSDAPPKKLVPPLTIKNHSSKKGEPKGLGENAFIDVKSMGENILKDLEEKYSGTCVGCGNSILLPHLNVHIKTIHPGKLVHCSCGFKGELYTTLVHSFHMSHIPNEARPIVLSNEDSEGKIMIVLEARPDLKAITFPCFKCSKRFKQEKSRQLHYNLCKLEKKFSCELCGEKFALENHLLKHKEWKHNPQTCSHCGKEFNSSSSLTQHVLHIHKKPLNQRCKQCGDTFNNAKQLKVHSRIHSGEQPHSCSHCSVSFISRNLLQKHIANHHKRVSSDEEDTKHDKSGRHKVKHKAKTGKGESSSSDSDSSDSDSELNVKKKKKLHSSARLGDKGSETDVKMTALTESDLDTSSSDVEVPIPKKSKPPSVKKQANKEQNSVQKGLDLKMNKAGIYQDREVVTLPPLRDDVKEKVEASVGRVCNPCGQEFDSAAGKLLHMYLIHPGLVLTLGFHDCSFCQHKFTSADDVSNHHLDKHQRTSLLNGNFRCICGLVFREDGAYYFHLYYAHKAQRALNIGGEIVCRLCEGRPRLNKIVDLVVHLSDRHTMFDHVRFNDSYMCNFCYKAFESWTVLSLHFFMVHKATKSQTLSYDCPYCQGASPWHSLEALQYHLDNVHRGRHTQSRPVPEHSRSIYTPAPAPASPTKRKDSPLQIIQMRKPPKSIKKPILHRAKGSHADPDVLYCICQCPYDEVSDMIGCDNPECKFQWFHFECVGIMAAPEGNWYCPDCTSFAQHKLKQAQKQKKIQADLYEYYSNYSNDATENEPVNPAPLNRSRTQSSSSNSSSSNSSSSSSSNSSSSSSSSSESSSGSGEDN